MSKTLTLCWRSPPLFDQHIWCNSIKLSTEAFAITVFLHTSLSIRRQSKSRTLTFIVTCTGCRYQMTSMKVSREVECQWDLYIYTNVDSWCCKCNPGLLFLCILRLELIIQPIYRRRVPSCCLMLLQYRKK